MTANSSSAPPIIRDARRSDEPAFFEISLKTGHLGGDASHLYQDRRLMGLIYSVPYLRFGPGPCRVLADDEGVAGYVIGALDTAAFERRLESDWWPALRREHPAPELGRREFWTADDRRRSMIHRPTPTPGALVGRFPGHVHMNLLPRAQGRGNGARLLEQWMTAAAGTGAHGVHVGVNRRNARAVDFWRRQGFARLDDTLDLPEGRTIWLGRTL